MNKKIISLIATFPLILFSVYYIHLYLLNHFDIHNTVLATKFYFFITSVTVLLITNLLLTYFLKHEYIGFVFLAWSMIKLMLAMAFFLVFIIKKQIKLPNNIIYEFIIIYMIYLLYEIIFSTQLLAAKKYG